MFSPIVNKEIKLPNLAEPKHPFNKENLGQFGRYAPF